jgi:hypothetical protein
MRYLKPACVLSVLVMISLSVFSKPRLFDGYYINKTGDSVLCKIEFADWSYNPKNIQVVVGGEKRSLGVADIRSFGIFGYSDYRSATVTTHTNPIALSGSLPEEFSDNQETKDWFLKIILKGDYTLYELVTPVRPYYFIGAGDSAITELVYRVKQNELHLSEDPQYKTTLTGFFTREGIFSQYQYAINNCIYSSSGIGSLVKILNEKHSGVKIKKTKAGFIQMDLLIGGIMSSFPSEFDGKYAVNNKFGSSLSGSGGLNLLFTFPSRFKSFAAGLSAEYYRYSGSLAKSGTISDSMSVNYHNTTTYTEKLSMSNSLIIANFYGMYFINHFSKTRFYIKAGVSVNVSVSNQINIQSNYTASETGVVNGTTPISESGQGEQDMITIARSFMTFNAAVGLMNGRSRLELNYYYSPTQLSQSDPGSFKIGMAGVHYYYAVFK